MKPDHGDAEMLNVGAGLGFEREGVEIERTASGGDGCVVVDNHEDVLLGVLVLDGEVGGIGILDDVVADVHYGLGGLLGLSVHGGSGTSALR